MAIKRNKDIDPKLAATWTAEDREDDDKWENGDFGKNPKYTLDASPDETTKIEGAIASLRRGRGRPKSEYASKGVFMNLPLELLSAIKLNAGRLNIGYQSYIRMALTQYLKIAEAAEANANPKAKKPYKNSKRKRHV